MCQYPHCKRYNQVSVGVPSNKLTSPCDLRFPPLPGCPEIPCILAHYSQWGIPPATAHTFVIILEEVARQVQAAASSMPVSPPHQRQLHPCQPREDLGSPRVAGDQDSSGSDPVPTPAPGQAGCCGPLDALASDTL